MYYPKSQIKTNLYTPGGEFYLVSNDKPYKGYYHVISGNSYITGRTPDEGKNQQLSKNPPSTPEDTDGTFSPTKIIVQKKSYESIHVGNIKNNQIYTITPKTTPLINRNLPLFTSPTPTPKDYSVGEFQRYFCKKNNQVLYLEISKKTYDLLTSNSPNIAFDLYSPVSIPWSISGKENQVFNINKKIATLKERNSQFYGFVNYFKNDWLKYYKTPSKPLPQNQPPNSKGKSGY
jgi:hypothetical protein